MSDLPSKAFCAAFSQRAGPAGRMTFAEFMDLALYHPDLGYYRRQRPRVGRGGETDFFTASSSAPVFGELVVAAALQLLAGRDPAEYTFVEIGAEVRGVLAGVSHPFAAGRTIGSADQLALSGRCVVFSNELFDAQPFDRFVFRAGRWRELGVQLAGGSLTEVEVEGATRPPLPATATEGQVFDAPTGAVRLARRIAAQPWTGVFIGFDYGFSFAELSDAMPAGTARAYHRHVQSNDLLSRPGDQDLTCHVCWDWIGSALVEKGFEPWVLESQEAFLVTHAGAAIAARSEADASRLTRGKSSLMQLLHPGNLGQKFQVLHTARW